MSKKGTVIYIGGFEMPDKNAAAQRVVSNGKAIKSLGHEVVFIGLSKSIKKDSTKEKYFNSDVYSKKYPINSLEWFKHFISFKYYIDIIKSYDNVKAFVCYNLSSISLLRLKRWAKKRDILIIADCTEWYEVAKGESFIKSVIKSFDIFMRMKIIQPKLDSVIAISKYLEEFYIEKGVKTIKIPPLIDSNDEKWKHKLNKSKDNIIQVVYAGSPFSLETKGQKDRLDQIVKLFIEFSKEISIKLNIIGVDKKTFIDFYKNFNGELKDDSIVFYGRVSHEEAIEKLKNSDFSIFLRENTLTNKAGFPTKFVEAITSGVPVLTNRSSNLSDFLIEGENGFWLDNTSIITLEDSLRKTLFKDKYEFLQMREKKMNKKLFDFRNYISEFESILN
ncbi:Glycosyltransferase involved in cell wall bisynthesis [Tenacibaculum sp. MAR_2010_89]|uniref:glycosyltransferase n=1 Tax=Tenacibaculum sp. MAR_2010_89 TaxID=1250198 RepID=UPI000894B1AD|nr:glycosyltransferase [Tenacibaculum sp. MAR_2010_89]SED67692.1 Glycosyltransferase involved in cell wall bisynthesis [Tenacibaculum sp. MAR_2010_89]